MEKINRLKKKFKIDKIDGYIVPKNDEFFSEYISDEKDRLKYISNFSGSNGIGFIYVYPASKFTFRFLVSFPCPEILTSIPDTSVFPTFIDLKPSP